jgi:hypothetical protein
MDEADGKRLRGRVALSGVGQLAHVWKAALAILVI